MLRCADRLCLPVLPTRPHAPSSRSLRYGLVTIVCNGTAHDGPHADETLQRALRLRRLLRKLRSEVETVAIAHGFDAPSLAKLRKVGWGEVLDVSSSVDPTRLMRPIGSLAAGKAGKHWPRALRRTAPLSDPHKEAAIVHAPNHTAFKRAQHNQSIKNYLGGGAFSTWAKYWELPRHTDPAAHACGTLPLLAWNLSTYDRVLLVSLDEACLLEDPLPWMRANSDAYLIGTNGDAPEQPIAGPFALLPFCWFRCESRSHSLTPFHLCGIPRSARIIRRFV